MSTPGLKTTGQIILRKGEAADAGELGRICYEAFKTISDAHNFPPDFPSVEVASGMMSMLLGNPAIYSVAALNSGGELVGSNFLWEYDAVAGVGPVTVDPAAQDSSIGRKLMEDVIARSDENGHPSVRLVQAAFHNRSLALYAKLGFDTVEPLSNIQGAPIKQKINGYEIRKMTESDLPDADAVAVRVHGITRRNEVIAAIQQGIAKVVEHNGRITGYTTGVGFFGHTVGDTDRDVEALIADADEFSGPGFLLPTRNSELMRLCLSKGLRIVQPLTLMSRGLYQEPHGAFLPSILY